MKRLSSLVLMVMLLMAGSLMAAQIKGLVVDKRTGEPLIGANVIVKGTTIGAATDVDGYFSFEFNPAGEFTLVVSYIGYKTQEKVLGPTANLTNLVFEMEEDLLETDVVVVTGIASKTSKAVSDVSVSRVSAEKLTEVNTYSDISQLLSGKVAGVKLSTSSGNIGSGFRFDVRSGGGLNGNGQPVIYIDGVRVENAEVEGFGAGGQGLNMLANLNPDEIENIEILKGPAAAASYGTDGSNGVVLITTKRGKLTGDKKKFNVSVKSTMGWHTQSYKFEKSKIFSADEANDIYKNGWIKKNFVSFSGGTGDARYFMSFSDNYESGIIPNNYSKNQGLRLNVDVTPVEKVFVSASASYTNSKIARPENDNNIYGWLGNTVLANPLYYGTSYIFLDRYEVEAIDDIWKQNRFVGSLKANWKPTTFMELNALVGVDHYSALQEKFYPPYPDYLADQGEKDLYNRYVTRYTYDLNAQFVYNIMPDLQGRTIVGAQILDDRLESNDMSAQTFSTELIRDIGTAEKLISMDQFFQQTKKAGLFIENNFNYQDKYFFNLMVRRDYTSSYTGKSFDVYYPKVSAAIRLDRVGVKLPYVTLLKLRAAYGATGQLPNLLDASRFLWTGEKSGWGTGAVPSYIGNPDLKPESIKEFEFGLDMDLLDKISSDLTVSILNADNSIVGFDEAPSTGKITNAIPFNVGKIQGWSVEHTLRMTPIMSRNVRLDLTLINSYQKNEVKDLGGAQPIFDGFSHSVIKKGLPKYEFYMQKVNGALLDPNTGLYAGVDATADRVSLGNPIAPYKGSFSFNLDLFQFANLYMLADWNIGNKTMYYTRSFMIAFRNDVEYGRLYEQVINPVRVANGLSPIDYDANGVIETPLTPGTPEYEKAANQYAKLQRAYPSNYLYDGSYFKLREITLSLNLSKYLNPYIGNYVSKVVLAFSAVNVLTITDYPGTDPEINFDGARSGFRGQEFLTLQHPRTYTMTLRFEL